MKTPCLGGGRIVVAKARLASPLANYIEVLFARRLPRSRKSRRYTDSALRCGLRIPNLRQQRHVLRRNKRRQAAALPDGASHRRFCIKRPNNCRGYGTTVFAAFESRKGSA